MKKLSSVVFVIFVVFLTSCGHQAWTKKGYKKGWIKDTIVRVDTLVDVDTFEVAKNVDTIFHKYDSLLYTICDTTGKVDTVKITKWKTLVKKELIAQGIYGVGEYNGKDLNIKAYVKDNKWHWEIADKRQIIKTIEAKPWYKEYNWIIFVVIAFLLGYFIGNIKK
jgi:hypothetical protein